MLSFFTWVIAPESWTVVLSFIQREREVLEPALASVDGAPVGGCEADGVAPDELSAGAETGKAPEEAATG